MLHHVEIYCNDLSRMRFFWEWFLQRLGYKIYQQWGQGFSMIYEKTYIVFVEVEEKHQSKKYHRCGPGLNHLAFRVDSRAKVDEMMTQLKERNIKILYEDEYPFACGENYYALYFEDPMRMKVELVADC